jgi:ribosomal 30S subunit maturation factor RimM
LWVILENIRVSSLNIILEIKYENDIVYIPFNDIIKINKKEKLIVIDPSEGLKDLNKK